MFDADPRHRRSSGLERPIRTSVPLDHVVDHPAWRTAQKSALGALSTRGSVVLIGGNGTGKTLFLRVLAHTLRQGGQNVVLHRPGSNLGPIRPEILLVDDAGRLPIRRLYTLAQHARHCVFAGPPSLHGRLSQLHLGLTLVNLAPLEPRAAKMFLSEFLMRSGVPVEFLRPDAAMALVEAAAGVPRRIEMLTGLVVFMARLEDVPQVVPSHVRAASEIQSETTLGRDELAAIVSSKSTVNEDHHARQNERLMGGLTPRWSVRSDTTAMLRVPLSSRKRPSALHLIKTALAALFGRRPWSRRRQWRRPVLARALSSRGDKTRPR